MKTLTAGDIITYNNSLHRVLRIFDVKGEQKIELKNLSNNKNIIVPYMYFSSFQLKDSFGKM